MMYVTAGRVGNYTRRMHFFPLYRFGVKLYKIHVTRKGATILRYDGFVPGTVTLDRHLRRKALTRAQEYAKEHGFIYRFPIRHNDPVPALEALAYAATNNNTQENACSTSPTS